MILLGRCKGAKNFLFKKENEILNESFLFAYIDFGYKLTLLFSLVNYKKHKRFNFIAICINDYYSC